MFRAGSEDLLYPLACFPLRPSQRGLDQASREALAAPAGGSQNERATRCWHRSPSTRQLRFPRPEAQVTSSLGPDFLYSPPFSRGQS